MEGRKDGETLKMDIESENGLNVLERDTEKQRNDGENGSKGEADIAAEPDPAPLWIRAKHEWLLQPGISTWFPVKVNINREKCPEKILEIFPTHTLAENGIIFKRFTESCQKANMGQDTNGPAVLLQNISNISFQVDKNQRIGTVIPQRRRQGLAA